MIRMYDPVDITNCCRCENKSYSGCLDCRHSSNFKAKCTYEEWKQERKEQKRSEKIKVKLNDLERLIPQYAANKTELDSYKKICDKENAQIKNIMKDFALPNYETGGYRATYSISKKESMNEDYLLSLFSSVPSFVNIAENCGIVKTKSYIDFDALEKAIYDGKLNNDQLIELDKAKEVKEVVTLRVTKMKEKKEEY